MANMLAEEALSRWKAVDKLCTTLPIVSYLIWDNRKTLVDYRNIKIFTVTIID